MDIPYIQWFPGHMTKTKRIMQKDITLVDMVVELLDARIPFSSKNPMLAEIIKDKPHILILNKSDMSDPNSNIVWKKHYEKLGHFVVLMDSKEGLGVSDFKQNLNNMMQEKIRKWNEKGMTGRKTRIMIVGITNVGKSTLINTLAGSKKTRVEDRPGVTRGRQWVSAGTDLEILDTPGVLWPKFDDPEIGERLAFVGSIKDDVIDVELLAMRLIRHYQNSRYENILEDRYNLHNLDRDLYESLNEYEILEVIGKSRGMLLPKNEIDTKRAATMLLSEFRSGLLGKITLEETNKNNDK